MKLTPITTDMELFLCELKTSDFSNVRIQKLCNILFDNDQSQLDKIEIAFRFVRDQIAHSWDIQSKRVTCKASEVLRYREGICYAKSNLLAALLRSQGIPTGFCYQKLMLFDTPEHGYCVHALNAVFVFDLSRWFRLDARGNKEGIASSFSITEERLAFFLIQKKVRSIIRRFTLNRTLKQSQS